MPKTSSFPTLAKVVLFLSHSRNTPNMRFSSRVFKQAKNGGHGQYTSDQRHCYLARCPQTSFTLNTVYCYLGSSASTAGACNVVSLYE